MFGKGVLTLINYKMKKNYLSILFIVALTAVSCSSDGGDDDVIDTPETFGSWSPAFSNQTSDFTQTRTGNRGTSQTRTINVTSSELREETDEYIEDNDVNGDGDKVDDVTLITTTYTGSENVGSHQINSYETDLDREPTFFNANSGFWYSEIFADVGNGPQSAGYLAYDIYLGDVTVYSSDDGECIEENEGDSDGGTTDVVVNTQTGFLGAIYDLYISDFDTTYDVYTGWERLTTESGEPYLAYFVSYYDTDYTYYLPSVQEFIDGTQDAIDFVENADLSVAGTLLLLEEENIPSECTSSSKGYTNSKVTQIPGFKEITNRFFFK